MKHIAIFKYKIEPADNEELLSACKPITMPKEAELLDAAFIGEELFVWAAHDVAVEQITQERKFRAIPTGFPVPLEYKEKYFRTVYDTKNGLVFHLYVEAW